MEVFDWIARLVRSSLVEPLLSNAEFQAGFAWGLIIALIVGLVSSQLLSLWNRVLQFFAPTKTPASMPGPSSADSTMSCMAAAVRLGVIVAVFLGVLYWLWQRLIQ